MLVVLRQLPILLCSRHITLFRWRQSLSNSQLQAIFCRDYTSIGSKQFYVVGVGFQLGVWSFLPGWTREVVDKVWTTQRSTTRPKGVEKADQARPRRDHAQARPISFLRKNPKTVNCLEKEKESMIDCSAFVLVQPVPIQRTQRPKENVPSLKEAQFACDFALSMISLAVFCEYLCKCRKKHQDLLPRDRNRT